jgi:hypothetical protein
MYNLCTAKKFNSDFAWFNAANCVQAAQLVRTAVEKFGDSAWAAVSSFVDYKGAKFPKHNATPDMISAINTIILN